MHNILSFSRGSKGMIIPLCVSRLKKKGGEKASKGRKGVFCRYGQEGTGRNSQEPDPTCKYR